MKKVKRGSSSAKSKPSQNVETYLARVPEPARSTLNRLRDTIRSAVPVGTVEVLSYGIPAFKHKHVLVWYAAFRNHCSLFPTPGIIEEFKNELKEYATSKGTIQFPVDKPLPSGLVKRLVRARVRRQNEE